MPNCLEWIVETGNSTNFPQLPRHCTIQDGFTELALCECEELCIHNAALYRLNLRHLNLFNL